MASFDQAFEKTLGHEGGFVDDPSDSGGATRFGITEKVAKEHGYKGEMKALPMEFAKIVYKKGYWDQMKLDNVVTQGVADELFDTGVNCGTGTAGKICQRSLNLLNQLGTLWPDIPIDGAVGLGTTAAINKCCSISPAYALALIKPLNALQVAYYAEVAERNPKNERFFRGWLTRG